MAQIGAQIKKPNLPGKMQNKGFSFKKRKHEGASSSLKVASGSEGKFGAVVQEPTDSKCENSGKSR